MLKSKHAKEMPIKVLRRALLILSDADEQMEVGNYDLQFLVDESSFS